VKQESRLAFNAALVISGIAGMFSGFTAAAQSNSRLSVITVAPQAEVRFVAPAAGQIDAGFSVNKNVPASVVARSVLQQYADQFGINEPDFELQEVQSADDNQRGPVVRYRQLRQSLPVIAGDVIVALTPDRAFESMTGKVSSRTVPTTAPRVTAEQAQRIAGIATAKYESVPLTSLVANEPELSIYDPQLLGPPSTLPPVLVWRINVQAYSPLEPIRYFVLVDAMYGSVVLNFNQAETVRNRMTYTGNSTASLPGTLLCDELQPLCTSGTNSDADAAHLYAGEMYDFFFSRFGRDSYNGTGGTINSTVQSTATPCPNAAWTGSQMIYCAGAPQADDVVGHELTHGVTSNTSRLFYYYQSGAINESISDVFGEFLDLTNTAGTDTPAVRWKMGENFSSPSGNGAIRDARNPPLFLDPDRMTSPFYWMAATDNGGVHTNSGVNNKAAYLMTDGDTFNGIRVVGIGLEKVARLYYEVETRYLTSGSDYADLHLALNQACRGLIGTFGFTADDCLQVANAVDAVEMNLEPLVGFNPEASICPINQVPNDVHFASFDTTAGDWSSTALVGINGWGLTNLFAARGARSYAITAALSSPSDSYIAMNSAVTVPVNAYLHFRHSYVFEFSGGIFYDGGVLEYTTNNGATWLDAGSLIAAGKNYGGTLDAGNALGVRPAFVGVSNGYVSTRLNLSSLAGSSIRFRFRNGADTGVASSFRGVGWTVDEVRLYTCANDPSPNLPPVANAGADQTVAPQTSVMLDASQSIDNDGSISSVVWSQVSGPQAVLASQGRRAASFVAPIVATQDTVVLRATVTDNRGAVSMDEVSILVVNQQPVATVGADQSTKPRNTVNVSGSGVDSDGTVASYNWTQVSGPVVTITNANLSAASFVAPSVAGSSTVVLRMTVLDNYDGSGSDDVSIVVVNDQPTANAGTDARLGSGSAVTLTGSGSDPDGTVAGYGWTQVGGTSVTLNNAATISATFTGHSPRYTETLTFRLTVTDNDGGTGADDVAIQIVGVEGDAPVAAAPPPPPAKKKGGGALDGSGLLLLAGLALAMAHRRRRVARIGARIAKGCAQS
jgi:bacillolysin